jgi:hypothetical protein
MPLTNFNPLSALMNVSPDPVDNPANLPANQAAASSSGPSWLSGSLAQISIIVLGLLLIAAGIFSFDKTREIIVAGTKTAAKVAA